MITREVLNKRGIYWENRIKTFMAEKVPENPIIFAGDSLTERFPLQKYFNENYINRGIGGDHADGLMERKELMGLEKNPKAILVMAGINDLLFNYQRDQIPANIEKFLKYILEKAPNCAIYVQSVCPVSEKQQTTTPAEIQSVNAELKTLAAKLGAKYLDIYPHLADEKGHIKNEYTVDGVHLSPAAYDIWAELVKKVLA